MGRKTLFGVLLVFFLAQAGLAVAGATEFKGEIRYRFEASGKDFSSSTGLDNFNLLRSRLGAIFTPSDGVRAFIQIQDSRTFGTEATTLSDEKGVDMHQAFFELEKVFGLPLDFKVGRMEAAYGDERLLGAVGWSNVGRSFDGVMLRYEGSAVGIDLFNLKTLEAEAAGDQGDRNLWGAYANLKVVPHYKVQTFLMWERAKPTDDLNRYTVGFYSAGSSGGLGRKVEFAYQGGKFNGLDVRAMMGALNVSYALKRQVLSPGVSAGVDYLSGDSDSTDADYEVFNTLYATNHKFYGFMDYFTDIPVNTMNLGLMDIHFGASAAFCCGTGLYAVYHVFNSVEEYRLSAGSTSKAFGTEMDLTARLVQSKSVSFVGGASFFSPGDIFKETMGSDASSWYYFMSLVSF